MSVSLLFIPLSFDYHLLTTAPSLRLAKKFNFVIFEDDAYYFLDFADPATKPRTYLTLESETNGETGRVLRFDSLSKIVSSGKYRHVANYVKETLTEAW